MPALGLPLYRAATRLLGPLARPALTRRAAAGKEDAARLEERFGHASADRPEGPLVWLHGASVGESLVLLALVKALKAERPDLAVLVTTGTVTSAGLMAKRLPEGALHQFAPLDRADAARRFLDHWRPDLGVFAESELWPNLLLAAQDRGIKLALVNARLTERSLARWRAWRASARALLSAFDWIGAADRRTAAGLSALLGRDVALVGNLKFAADPPPADPAALDALRGDLAGRSAWLAASTHPGEEAIVLAAHRRLREAGDDRLLILAPRHPERGPEAAALAQEAGFTTRRRAAGEPFDAEADVYVADTLGEMGLWFRLADAAFIGGSLIEGVGGHNPIEPALLSAPIITGPHTFNFEDLYDALVTQNGAALVHNSEELFQSLQALTEQLRLTRVDVAQSIASHGVNVLEDVLGNLRPLLPELRNG